MSNLNRFAALKQDSGSKEPSTPRDQAMPDAAQPSAPSGESSLSLNDLGASLPTSDPNFKSKKAIDVRNQHFMKWGRQDRAQNKKARREAAAPRPDEAMEDASLEVVHQTPSAAPKPDEAMEVQEKLDCRAIINPKNFKCFFKYQDTLGRAAPIVGDLSSKANNGFSATVEVDGGRFGSPMVSLGLRVNKGDKKVPVSSKSDQYHECRATWRAGITIEDLKVIREMTCRPIVALSGSTDPLYEPTIVDSCPPAQLQRLMGINFVSTYAELSPVGQDWFKGLHPDVENTLNELFFGVGTHRMTMWFYAFPDANAAYVDWGRHLEAAAKPDFCAFWQYLDKNNQPNYSIERMEPISRFADAMYARYAKIKQDGRVVEDKSIIEGYHTFEKKLFWEVDYEFGIFNTIPVIREVQFEEAQVAHFAFGPQLVHLQRMPSLKAKGNASYVPTQLAKQFKGFVKLATKGAAPPAHARIHLQWDNAVTGSGKPHIWSTDSKDTWHGRVMKNMEGPCRTTGTDFCIWFTRPEGGAAPRVFQSTEEKLADNQFVLARLKVILDRTSAQREINGMAKLAEQTIDERLAVPRMALMSDPSRLEGTVADLTEKNREYWAQFVEKCRAKYTNNKEQFEMATCLQSISNGLTACIGPPGTGKTTVLADAVVTGAICKLKTMVCAVSNNAVDKAANSCWESIPEEYRQQIKVLRYETTSAELQAITTRADFDDPTQNENERPTYKAPPSLYDDDSFSQALDEVARLQSENQEQLRALFNRCMDQETAVQQKWELDSRKQSNVPAAMTLPNRIFRLTLQDQSDAADEFRVERQCYLTEKGTAQDIDEVKKGGIQVYKTDAALAALGRDAISLDEFNALVAKKDVKSIDERDKSADFRKLLKQYRAAEGKLPRQAMKKFIHLRDEVVQRVFEDTDIVFTTCNNAGSELVQSGFSPEVIWIDEAGQLTMAALANVLTSFKSWRATILLGDPNQLKPFSLSGKANEFAETYQASVLDMLQDKGYPILRLIQQYRMAPAIVQWVSRFFYKGMLMNSPRVIKDNDFRRIAREVSKRKYGIKGPNGRGSEYWMIDIAHGLSKVQHNGTSLQNYANADAIAALVDEFLAKDVKPAQISVLTYYTGQMTLVIQKIEAKTDATGRQWQLGVSQVSSVDAFQGEENEFVIVDVVVAHQRQAGGAITDDSDGSGDEEGPAGLKRSGTVTSHVKSANRLCCALTRGKNCVVVVCQLSALLKTYRPKQTKASAAIGNMAKDCIDRELVYHDYTSLDSDPSTEDTRAKWDQARRDDELRVKNAEHMNLLSTHRHKKAQTFHEKNPDSTRNVYRTQSRRTTRPNMRGSAAERAENHDKVLDTDAGAVHLKTGGHTQRAAKAEKKERAKQAEMEKAAAEAEGARGKGKGRAAPVEEKGEGKEKEDKGKDPSTMDTS